MNCCAKVFRVQQAGPRSPSSKIIPCQRKLHRPNTTTQQRHKQPGPSRPGFFVSINRHHINTMAIVLEANYAKKLGLPGYSSHQYSISVRIELTDLSQVEAESTRLYQQLQAAVDKDIQEVGFIPPNNYGDNNPPQAQQNGRSYQISANGHHNGNNRVQQPVNVDRWSCTDGQRGLILRIVEENDNITKQEVEALSHQLFGVGVKQLNKMQASQLIEDLFVKAGKPPIRNRWQKQPTRQAA